ncbi:hypothetical protein PROFUN_08412 [Planoprotostelium fungivorum]|uniref:RNA ligase domain-containing protein n=1 Tax=Planoprotostelium fungivorum TaxID=1890364 RepID=A0A2P6NJU3_9EUKA|nr:hypothetical protein PROFUN_08412 [Planoprotostelium fungivorum]
MSETEEIISMPESSDRPLAYVQIISDLKPIEGADMIEVATVLGWQVVVKKGQYEFFIDDKLDRNNFRIKTIKLRGQISQGYCIRLTTLETHPHRRLTLHSDGTGEEKHHYLTDEDTKEQISLAIGSDLTSLIGIKKYEIPDVGVRLAGNAGPRGNFPSFLRKTDQERIQNNPHYTTSLADVDFEVSEKLEGSSVTAFYKDGKYGVCSRNLELRTDDDTATPVRVLNGLGVGELLSKYAKNVALQGELIGPGIQKNIYNLTSHRWVVFDVYLIDHERYTTAAERIEILNEINYPDRVPVLEKSWKFGGKTVGEVVKMAEGISALKKGQQREGIVFKSNSLGRRGDPVSFKAISNVYLLKQQ